MSVTLLQLRNKVRALLREDSDNTHFTDSVLNGFLNEAAEYAAVFIEYPRDLVSVLAADGVGSYPNPADNLLIRTAYFGNRDSLSGDIQPLTIVNEDVLTNMYPSWMDQTSGSKADRPQYLIQIDRKTIYVYPRPNAIAVSNSRKIFLNYNYVPASMTNDSDVPDLPLPYHNIIVLYALHLCYLGIEKNEASVSMYKMFEEKVDKLKSAVTKETKPSLGFSWGTNEGLGDGDSGGVIP